METVKYFGLLILLLYCIILNFEAEAMIDGRNIRLQEFKEEVINKYFMGSLVLVIRPCQKYLDSRPNPPLSNISK